MKASIFTDLLETIDEQAKLLGTYSSDYYAGSGALVCNFNGEGRAYYYGSVFNVESAKIFLDKLGVASPYGDIVEAPETCEIAMRVKDGKRFLFLLNYRKDTAEIILKQECKDLYTGEVVKGAYLLPSYGTMIVEL